MKKKFIDFLFEDDVIEETETTLEVLNDHSNQLELEKKYEEKLLEKPKPVKKDYNLELNRTKTKTMIDFDEPKPSRIKNISKAHVAYEVREPISPIFGIASEKVFTTPQIAKDNVNQASKIGTIISPIYGTMVEADAQKPTPEPKNDVEKKIPPRIIDYDPSIFMQKNDKVVESLESKTTDDNVEVLDIGNGFDKVSDQDFFNEIIEENDDKVVISRDISLFDEDK